MNELKLRDIWKESTKLSRCSHASLSKKTFCCFLFIEHYRMINFASPHCHFLIRRSEEQLETSLLKLNELNE